MRGLLIKDVKLLLNQKQFFIVVLFIAVLLTLSGQNPYFIVSYSTLICAFFTISTVSYDEFDNGYAFLFTLPISRKGYAIEKYLFGLLVGGGIWLLTTLGGGCLLWVNEPQAAMQEWFLGTLAIFLGLMLMLCLMIPIQLKFGADKSRIVSIIMVLAFFACIEAVKIIKESFGIYWNAEWIGKIGAYGWTAIGVFLLVALVIISIILSIRIVEKKQL